MPSRTKGKLKAAKSSVKEIQLDQNRPRHALCGGGGGQQQQQKSSDENEGLLLLTQANGSKQRNSVGRVLWVNPNISVDRYQPIRSISQQKLSVSELLKNKSRTRIAWSAYQVS